MTSTVENSDSATPAIVRRLLLLVFVAGLLMTAAELLLVGHTEDAWQWAPLLLIALSLAALVWDACGGGRPAQVSLRGLMYLNMASGIVGLVLHYQAKVEFKLEMNPGLAGAELFWAAVHGPAPPVLAPLMMVQIGILGLAWSYCRPIKANY